MTTSGLDRGAIDDLDRAYREAGPPALLDRLIATLDEQGRYRELLDALLLKARYDLGLPIVSEGPLGDIPEPGRTQYEERYVAALRRVGHKFLDAGNLVAAWPYFRVLGEKEPIAEALEKYEPGEGDDRIGHVIDIAFQEGANPRRGFELILSQYGACSAISAFEGLPADEVLRAYCAGMLVRHLHDHLDQNLRAEISRRGQPLPDPGVPLLRLIAGRPWLFADDAYHIDVSHLASVVRTAPLLTDPNALDLAIGLTDYGRNLSAMHRYEGTPPFDRVYEDHAVFLRALRGQGVDAAIAHFREKLSPSTQLGDSPPDPNPAMVLVRLLARLGRLDQAIEIAAGHLTDVTESELSCPSLAQLSARSANASRMAQSAQERGDLVAYSTALLLPNPGPKPD
ncbi:MAG: hypothetical protein U0800_09125 [Isosphaeraceae bacterium]